MRRTLAALILAVVAGLAPTAGATTTPHVATLGMRIEAAHDLYPQARRITARDTGAVTLELSDVSFAETRWATVDFVFDAAGRLDRVQLITRNESFDHLRARLRHDTDAFLGTATPARLIDRPETLEMKICDFGASGVFLTYERINDPV